MTGIVTGAGRILGACTLLLILAAGCSTAPPAEAPSTAAELPEAPPLAVAGAVHYRIDPDPSRVHILVYRDGPLAKFGHNHVVTAGNLAGDVYLANDFHDSGFRLRIPVNGLVVDPPAARQAEGGDFEGPLSDEARQGTRENMLGPEVLDAAHYPDIEIRSIEVNGPDWAPDVTVRITLHGAARDLTVPVAVTRDGGRVTVTGTLEVALTDFGLTPFSVMGGGLRVRDGVRVRFRLVAVRDRE